jgi:putative tricarboxylic transport membrane protein
MSSLTDHGREPIAPRPSWAGPRATGLGLLALGVVALLATFAIPAGRDGWAMTGARFFPLLVSFGLIVCALAQLLRATLLPDAELGRHAAQEAAETEWRTPAIVAAALVGYVLVLEPFGYIVATALFFPVAAWALGSTRHLRDAISGVVFSVLVDLLFTQMLAVPLPIGIVGF